MDFVTPASWADCYYLLSTDAELSLSSVKCAQNNKTKPQIPYTKEVAWW